ncbi:MAG: OmpA family protein [Opitutales bacterium]|nr:OmpA family protein [Opitutales bacterium]
METICHIRRTMYKTARYFFTLLLVAILLPACTKKQLPSGYGTDTGMGSGADYGDIVPSLEGDYGLGAEGLEARAAGDGINGNKYGDWDMVEGILPSVYFGFDSSSISASERAKLQQAADYLMDNPAEALLIEGHCDWYGTAEYNIALGERRAISAKDYITTLGISPSRVNTLSKGSLESTSGLSKEQSSQDRRADLIILK